MMIKQIAFKRKTWFTRVGWSPPLLADLAEYSLTYNFTETTAYRIYQQLFKYQDQYFLSYKISN